MCCLFPEKQGLSDNIKVTSIVGHLLEHSRIFWFNNNNNPEVFLGSADWMRRNLDRRVEAVTPVLDEKLKEKLLGLLEIYLKDNTNAWEMKENGEYILKSTPDNKFSSQFRIKDYWMK